jgi:hypothetical protein
MTTLYYSQNELAGVKSPSEAPKRLRKIAGGAYVKGGGGKLIAGGCKVLPGASHDHTDTSVSEYPAASITSPQTPVRNKLGRARSWKIGRELQTPGRKSDDEDEEFKTPRQFQSPEKSTNDRKKAFEGFPAAPVMSPVKKSPQAEVFTTPRTTFHTPRKKPNGRRKRTGVPSAPMVSPAVKSPKRKVKKAQKLATPGTPKRARKMTKKGKAKVEKDRYGKKHHKAATKIQALVRGRADRMYKVRPLILQKKINDMQRRTEDDILKIEEELVERKKEFKTRAKERFKKNLDRKGKGDETIQDSKDIIAHLKKENALVREKNARIFSDVRNLRINNQRLSESLKMSEEYFDQLKYHEAACKAEHAKLTKVEGQYKKAVEELQDALENHTMHANAEHKIKLLYNRLLASVLEAVDKSDNQILIDDVYDMADYIADLSEDDQ